MNSVSSRVNPGSSTAKRRVLYISHDHPSIHVGGAEVFTYELFSAMREEGSFEPVLLARTVASGHRFRTGSPFFSLDGDPHQILWAPEEFDGFWMTSRHKAQYTTHFQDLLEAYRPDVVHIQQAIGLGFDLIRQIRRTLPDAALVFTLHEFQPICHAHGHMIRTGSTELCSQASPLRCHECFPDVAPNAFLLRERLIKSHLEQIDLFLAPSVFLLERYVAWGIPRHKIRFLENGRRPQSAVDEPSAPAPGGLGFFGQLHRDKGILVLLEAVKRLAERGAPGVHLYLNGANLDYQEESFRRRVAALLEACGERVTFRGRYQPEELPERMRDVAWVVVPSIWWENSPMVIQEAFMHGRPVICSDIGGMAEKVRDGVDGLHFRVADAADLAAVLERATASPKEWQRLRAGIRPIYPMSEAVREHCAAYQALLEPELARPGVEHAGAENLGAGE